MTFLQGKKEYDPELKRSIAGFLLIIEKEGKSDEYKKKATQPIFSIQKRRIGTK